MTAAAKTLPAVEVAEKVEALMAVDGYGMRSQLPRIISGRGE